MKGRVKWWNNETGYGFIEYQDETSDFVYLNKSEYSIILKDGEIIEFDLKEEQKGLVIYNLKQNSN